MDQGNGSLRESDHFSDFGSIESGIILRGILKR